MKTVLVLLVCAALGGCMGLGSIKQVASVEGAKAADDMLATYEWGLCNASTVGAWHRRYGQNPVKREAWQKLCGKDIGANDRLPQ